MQAGHDHQEGNPKGSGAVCLRMPAGEATGRRPAWLNRELWLGLREKKVYELWKNGQAAWEDYEDVMR